MTPPSPSRPTILQTEWSTGWGGQEIRTLDEMQGLREQFNFHVACRPEAEFGRLAEKAGFPVTYLPFRGRLDRLTIGGLRRVIHQQAIRVIHTHSSIDAYCGGIAGRLTGTPVVRTRHLMLTEKPGIKLKLLYGWLTNTVICTGEHIRQTLITSGACTPDRAVTLRPGVDLNRFTQSVESAAEARRLIRAQWNLSEDAFVVGIIAMLRMKKGHLLLLDAFSRCLAHAPHAHLMIIGEGPARAQIEKRIIELNLQRHVTMTGYQDAIPAYLQSLDLCAVPSYEEACSQVSLQAMVAGIPVLGSNVGGLPELITPGETGQLFPCGDVESLASCLRYSVDNPDALRRMRISAAEHAQAHFSREAQLENLASVYRRLFNQCID